MMDRIILEKLIARLEKDVGQVNQEFFSAWEGEEESLAARTAAGKGHFAQAVLYAREALASGDDEQIRTAAQICPTLERTGKQLADKAKEAERAAELAIQEQHRRNGGNATGKRLADEAEWAWAPYVKKVNDLVASGTKETIAKRLTKKAMVNDGFVLPSTGQYPSKTTINNRLIVSKK